MREAEIAVGDLGIGRLLRLEEDRALVDALVGHLRDADVRLRLRPGERAGRRMSTREQIEERGLADVRQAGDRRDEVQASAVASTLTSSPKIVRATKRKRSAGPVAYTSCLGRDGPANSRRDTSTSRTASALGV